MSEHKSSIVASLFYNDPEKAMLFLEEAFGLEFTLSVTDDAGNLLHGEMSYGNGRIMIGGTSWAPWPESPASLEGRNTQALHVAVADADAHCEKARAAGARIVAEPEDQFYGDRTYRALDCEGHFWTFGHTFAEKSLSEMEQASGFKMSDKKP